MVIFLSHAVSAALSYKRKKWLQRVFFLFVCFFAFCNVVLRNILSELPDISLMKFGTKC